MNFHKLLITFCIYFHLISNSYSLNIIRDSEIETELEEIANILVEKTNYKNRIKVRVVLDNSYNAFVIGDDTIYLNSGLLTKAHSIEEIIGIMAHELGHIISGHVFLKSEDFKNVAYTSLLSAAAAIALASGGSSEAALGIMIGGSDQGKKRFFKSSRNKEAVADEWAVKLLREIKVSNDGLVKLLRRLSSKNQLYSSSKFSYYSTHPDVLSRISIFEQGSEKNIQDNSFLTKERKLKFYSLIVKIISFTGNPKDLVEKDFQTNLNKENIPQDLVKYSRAIANFRLGNLDYSRKLIKELINFYPQNPYFYEFLGDINFSSGKFDLSIKNYKKSLKIKPDNTLVLFNLGKCLSSKKSKEEIYESISVLEKVVTKEPNWSLAKRQLAIAYGRSGKLANADFVLAEDAILRGEIKEGINFARRALKHSNIPADIRIKAEDIIFFYNKN